MSKAKKIQPAGPARRVAWHLASDINWVALYRSAMAAMASMILAMVVWQSNRIITRQDDQTNAIAMLRTELSVERANVMNLGNDVAGLSADLIKGDTRLSRTNERQTEMMNAIAVLQSRVDDLRMRP